MLISFTTIASLLIVAASFDPEYGSMTSSRALKAAKVTKKSSKKTTKVPKAHKDPKTPKAPKSSKAPESTKAPKSPPPLVLLKYSSDVVGPCAIDQSCDTDASNSAVAWFINEENHSPMHSGDWDDAQVWKERLVLAIWYYSTGGLDQDISLLTWPSGPVTSLEGSSSYVTDDAVIPTEIGLLSSLETIYLYKSSFSGTTSGTTSGTIPTEIGQLTSLKFLWLKLNALLTGTIPTEIGQLSSLDRLFLNDNALTGTIPTEIGQMASLNELFLNDNALTGTIPTEIGQMASLNELYLQNNALTGTIPTEIGQMAVLHLRLGQNALTGTIPTEIGQLSSLDRLFLENNALTGTIPTEIGQMASLTDLQLGQNALTGTIPTEIGQLETDYELYLGNNALTGTIPTEIGQVSSVDRLFLQDNALTGTIPTEIGQMASLRLLDLGQNALTGTIPTEIGQLETDLYLGNNALTGTIPTEIVQMPWGSQAGYYQTELSDLVLSNNALTGTIPTEFGLIIGASELMLDGNEFSGPFPSSLKQGWSNSMFFHGNNLSGPISDELCDRIIGNEVTWFVADVDNCIASKPNCCPPCSEYFYEECNTSCNAYLACVAAQELHGFPSASPTMSSAPSVSLKPSAEPTPTPSSAPSVSSNPTAEPTTEESAVNVEFNFHTDDYPGESRWELVDEDAAGHGPGTVIKSNGEYGDQLEANTLHSEAFALKHCVHYTLTVYDSWCDGLSTPGYFEVLVEGQRVMGLSDGVAFGSSDSVDIYVCL